MRFVERPRSRLGIRHLNAFLGIVSLSAFLALLRELALERCPPGRPYFIFSLTVGQIATAARSLSPCLGGSVPFSVLCFALVLLACLNLRTRRTYDAFCRAARYCLRRRAGPCLVLAAMLCFLSLAAVAILALLAFPNSADEYSYVYMADTLRAHRVTNTAAPLSGFFYTELIVENEGKRFGIFPPGWSLLLAGASHLRLPLVWVNPILGALSLLLVIGIGRTLYNDRVAFASALMLWGSSFFLLNSASYFPHTFCSVLLLLCLALAKRWVRDSQPVIGILIGFCAAWAGATRYLTALLCLAPIGLVLLIRKPRVLRGAPWVLLGALPWFAFHLIYNKLTTGDLLVPALVWAGTDQYYWFPPMFLSRGLHLTCSRLEEFAGWTPQWLLLCYGLAILSIRRNAHPDLGAVFLVLVAGYGLYCDTGGNRYGPRYFYSGFPFLVLFTCSEVFREKAYQDKSRWGRFLFNLFLLGFALHLVTIARQIGIEGRVVRERTDLLRATEGRGLRNAIVFLSTGTGSVRPMPVRDLTRNGIDFTGPILYVWDLGEENRRLMARYPGREYYRYTYPGGLEAFENGDARASSADLEERPSDRLTPQAP